MNIKVLWIDNYLENGTITDEQYKEKEEYIKRLKKVATKDRNMYATKDEIFFINGSEKILMDDSDLCEDICSYFNSDIFDDDYIDIAGINFYKIDIIPILNEKLKNNASEIVNFVNNVFMSNECTYDFEYKLIDLCFKYLIDKKIKELEELKQSIDKNEKIIW